MTTIRSDGDEAEAVWDKVAKNLIRAELMRRGISYAGLAERLAAIGIEELEVNLKNKVGRGRFNATFLLQCMAALEVQWLQVPTVDELLSMSGEHGGQRLAAREKGRAIRARNGTRRRPVME